MHQRDAKASAVTRRPVPKQAEHKSEQLVEQTVRRYESDRHAMPLSDAAMRPREQPALSRVSVTFTARCEIALRGAVAAVAAGVMHALHPNPLTVLIVAVSILCSSANIGTTLRLCTHSVVGCALTLPLAWLMLCVSSLEPAGSRPLAATGVIGAVAVPIGYARLPVVARPTVSR